MIEKIKKAHELLKELKNEYGIISVDGYYKAIHMRAEDFFARYSHFKAEMRDSFRYPVEVYTYEGDFKIFSMLSDEEAAKYIRKEHTA